MRAALLAVLIIAVGSVAFIASAREGLTREDFEWLGESMDWYIDANFALLGLQRHLLATGRSHTGDVVSFSQLPHDLQLDLRTVADRYFPIYETYFQEIRVAARARSEGSEEPGWRINRLAERVLASGHRRDHALSELINGLVRDRADIPVEVMRLRLDLVEALGEIHDLWEMMYMQEWFR